jgi:DNA-binding transcriptional regulator LsrR (DeoR family)
MPAGEIARKLNLQLETVYAELVRASDQGKVRINVHHDRGRRVCEWEAMDEVQA